jgi:Domain of unknown function (DUF3854)
MIENLSLDYSNSDDRAWQRLKKELDASAIHPDIQRLNFRPVRGQEVYELLLSEAKGNKGAWADQGIVTAPVKRLLDRYQCLTEGGWWVSGVDPLNNWEPMAWGEFKGDRPRSDIDKPGKTIKYEPPKDTKTAAHYLRVSWRIGLIIARKNEREWDYIERILQAYGAADPEAAELREVLESYILNYSEATIPASNFLLWFDRCHEDTGFWQWAWEENLSPTLTEGAKKGAAFLSAGYLAIAIPGVTNAVRTKDDSGNRLLHTLLNPWLERFATEGREWFICFDHDPKKSTRKAVDRQIQNIYWALLKYDCAVKIVRLPGPDKGADDFIASVGSAALQPLFADAEPLDIDRVKRFQSITHPIDLRINERWVSDAVGIPDAKLICVKSPKNTGKTEWLKKVVDQAHNREGKPIPVHYLTHRVQLGKPSCDRLGLTYIGEEGGSAIEQHHYGFGCCLDSLSSESAVQFKAQNFDNCIVICDEAEQLFKHALFGATEVGKRRTEILRNLQDLFKNVFESEHGKVILLDADLSDTAINFAIGMSGVSVEPYIIVNDWRPTENLQWDVFRYDSHLPTEWFANLYQRIEREAAKPEGTRKKIMVCVQGQDVSSTWGTQNLELLIKTMLPQLRTIRIDSNSVGDPTHEAFEITSHLNEEILNWDVFICSPTLETGVSIDVKDVFDSVWQLTWGLTDSAQASQGLARVRDPIERHVWAKKTGIKRYANGETSLYRLLNNQDLLGSKSLEQITRACKSFDPDIGFVQNPTAINTYGKYVCIHNADSLSYRENLFKRLTAEGHNIKPAEISGEARILGLELYEILKFQKEKASAQRDEAIANADDISPNQYKELAKKRSRTQEQAYEIKKHELQERYEIPVDAALVERDRDGWHGQIRLHYYLTVGRIFLEERDHKVTEMQLKGGKELWMPTYTRSVLSLQIKVLEELGILALIAPERAKRGYRGWDEDLVELYKKCRLYAKDIKLVLGITVPQPKKKSDDDDPDREEKKTHTLVMKNFNLYLDKIGMKVRCDRQEGGKGNRIRIYELSPPRDGRENVFAKWIDRDLLSRSQSAMHSSLNYLNNSEEVAA